MTNPVVDTRSIISQLQTDLSYLATAPDVNISSLSRKAPSYMAYLRAFKAIQDLYPVLPTEEYKLSVVDYIHTLKRPSVITPGTIGAFLFGCLYNVPEGTNPFCSPSCIESIPPVPVSDTITLCEYNIWAFVNGELRHYSGSGPEARVYNSTGELSPAMLNLLASNGVKKVVTYDDTGSQIGIQSTTPEPNTVTQEAPAKKVTFASPIATAIPATASPIDVVAAAGVFGQERGSTSFLSDWRILLVLVLVLVAVGIVGYMLYKYFTTPSKPVNKEAATPQEASQ